MPLAALSKEITLEWLENKPRSIPKDYYIWRFLDQNISSYEAQKALEMAKSVNYKLFFRYATKIDDPAIKRVAQCLRMAPSLLVKQEPSCIAAAITPYKMTKLSTKERLKVFKKLQNFPHIKEKIKFLLPTNPIKALLHSWKDFLSIANSCGKSYRKRFFDRFYPKSFLQKIQKRPGFRGFVKRILTEELEKAALSLTLLDPKKLDGQTSFYIGLIAYKKGLFNIAAAFFQRSLTKSYHKRDKDKALFWLYKSTQKRAYLEKLANSQDLNIYSLYAKELLDRPISYLYLTTPQRKSVLNLSDPFVCLNLFKEYNDLYYKNSIGAFSLLLEKISSYKLHPFVTPYEEYLVDYPHKALLYAIARQESRFIAGSISRSFALGPMQFMPFLAKKYAKEHNLSNFDLDWMFQESTAVSFGKEHILYLYKKLHHPLFVAYAYNGGIGYTKREVLKLFDRYEPFLAMELVSYTETNRYGKKVLTNYYIYRHILKQPIKLQELLGLLKR